MSIFAEYTSQIFYPPPPPPPPLKYFSEQILEAIVRNSLNILVIVSRDMQECGLVSTFVRAILQ